MCGGGARVVRGVLPASDQAGKNSTFFLGGWGEDAKPQTAQTLNEISMFYQFCASPKFLRRTRRQTTFESGLNPKLET